MLSQFLPIFVLACNQEPISTVPCDAVEADRDGDGYARPTAIEDCFIEPGPADCDDEEAAVHPGATEICDGLDNDCDGSVDEAPDDEEVRYTDADGDGFGDPEAPIGSCAETAATVANSTDCDDSSAGVHPGAVERCNGLDDDCDGEVDDDPIDGIPLYEDRDGDGWGDDTVTGIGCPDTSEATQTGDCNDDHAGVHPDAIEVCDDGLDNDCDTTANDCYPTGEVPAADHGDLLVGAEGDYLGARVASAGDLDGDGQSELLLAGQGSLWVTGVPSGPAPTIAQHAKHTVEMTMSTTVPVMHGLEDLDGDGIADLAVGDVRANEYAGAVSIHAGPIASQPDIVLGGTETLGAGLATGDMNGDGIVDLLIGDQDLEHAGLVGGGAYIVHGPVTTSSILDHAATKIVVDGQQANAGEELASLDFDGDGLDDIALGAPNWNYAPTVMVFGEAATLGSGSTLVGDDNCLVLVPSEPHTSAAGVFLAAFGDVDGDGHEDLAVGDPLADGGAGIVYILEGGAGHATGTRELDTAEHKVTSSSHDDGIGWSAAVAGDVDGDGITDHVFGAPQAGPLYTGGAYVVLGDALHGTVDLAKDAPLFMGDDYYGYTGESVAGVGDLDGDGKDELLVGGHGYGDAQGHAWLIWGTGL